MYYPRLIQRYGRNCVKESLIKGCQKDRTRVLVGPATYEEYGLCLNYKHGWKSAVRERKERLKPVRDVSQRILSSQRTEPPVVDDAPRLDISMAARLQEIRPPQLHEAYVFTDQEGRQWRVPVSGNFSANHSQTLLQMASAGQGVALLADWLVADKVEQGELLTLLPECTLVPAPVRAVIASTRHVHPRVRMLIDFLQERLKPQLEPSASLGM